MRWLSDGGLDEVGRRPDRSPTGRPSPSDQNRSCAYVRLSRPTSGAEPRSAKRPAQTNQPTLSPEPDAARRPKSRKFQPSDTNRALHTRTVIRGPARNPKTV